MKKKLILIVLLLLFSNIAFAVDVNLNTKVDKNKITIGDRIKYEVILEYADGIEIEPSPIAENLGKFEIKDYGIIEPKKEKDGRWISETFYIITTFTTGEFSIPPVTVRYKDRAGNKHEITSKPIKINVESVKHTPEDKDDIRPLKAPVEIKGHFPVWLLVLILLLIAGSSLGFFIYFRKKRTIAEEGTVPPRPAEEIAMEELKSLLEMRLVEKGLIKEYHIRVSDIIRKYIEARFKVLALDRTTWELYQEMRSRRIERLHVDRIRDFLEDCDLVKFAKYIPTRKEIDEAYNKAREIIEITTPKINDNLQTQNL